jgi:hypothetical protein
MSEPWFDPNTFGAWFGTIVGGGGGTLGGLIGAVAGALLPSGKGKRLVFGSMFVLMVVGLVMLAIGLYALVDGQPYGIWYPMVLAGAIFGAVNGGMLLCLRSVGRVIERRKMEADDLRHC